jgi:hypothetical protein
MDSSAHFREPRARAAPAIVVALVALAARIAAVAWAGARFPPAADGVYYHTLATRIATGLGSTWAWPDGAVTYAAHYPIGYPALLALAYRIGAPGPVAGGVLNALLGTAGTVAAYALVRQATSPRWSFAAGLAVALHPALVMYTPALMTEGVVAALVAVAAWLASRRSLRSLLGAGIVLGVATLVRPQSLLLSPIFGLLSGVSPTPAPAWNDAVARLRRRATRAAAVTAMSVAVCLPWTARNCIRMHHCALVSFNGGWNLLIGAGPGATGTWAPVDVPEACRTVWDEAEKDACFAREARNMIARAPWRWLALVPARLAATFDYGGAPGYYLHASNASAFDGAAKIALGVVETAFERLAWMGALAVSALVPGPRRRARLVVSILSAFALFYVHGYWAVLGLVASLALLGRALLEMPFIFSANLAVLVATASVHAVFFGAGRYSMIALPLVTALAFAWPVRPGAAPPVFGNARSRS